MAEPAGPGPVPAERIEAAAAGIDPVFTGSPQWSDGEVDARLGVSTVLKLETLNPIRSFKGRGADWFVATASDRLAGGALVCASAGNFGQAVAYAARRRGLPVTVFAAETANPLKVARMRALGARVRLAGADLDAAKEVARTHAERHGHRFVEDGAEPAVSEGAGTIGRELAAWPGGLDAVLVPVGNGALIGGIAGWFAAAAPATRIIGVCAAGADAMARSWRSGRVVTTERVATIADGIAVRLPVPAALAAMTGVVHDMVTVEDAALVAAMRLLWETVGIAVEPAGVAGIAALLAHPRLRGAGRVATPLCGANLTAERRRAWLCGAPPGPSSPDLSSPGRSAGE